MDLADRVIDDNTKTFKVRADLLILDDTYQGCQIDYPSPVPVFNDVNQLIGGASLSVEGNVLVADLYLDYSTPERLSIETKTVPIYPHVDSTSDVYKHRDTCQVLTMHVKGLILALYPTSDDRIGPL